LRSDDLCREGPLNGLQWFGTIDVVAQSVREYDLATGWQPWSGRSNLATYELAKRNDQWNVLSANVARSPPDVRFYRPTMVELPTPPDVTERPELNPQAAINGVVTQRLKSISDCYRGTHQLL
jgi:hypothetical protein